MHSMKMESVREGRAEAGDEAGSQESDLRNAGVKLSQECKKNLKKPEGPDIGKMGEWEALIRLWDAWIARWPGLYAGWREHDEQKEIAVARRIRKNGKSLGQKAAEVNAAVEAALKELALKRPHPPPGPPPPEDPVFPMELMTLRRKRVRVATKRLEEVLRVESLQRKATDEMAISKATLIAAKARVLGKAHKQVEELRLPVRDFEPLKSGRGIRTGVSHFTGGIIEELRQRLTKAGELSLRSRGVDDEWAEQVATAMQKEQRLIKIDLSSNKIGRDSCKWLAIGIAGTTALRSLNLSSNKIDKVGLDQLSDGLLINRTVESLRVSSLKFGEHIPRPNGEGYVSGLGRFADFLPVSLSLTKLDLGGNKMGAELFGELADALTLNRTVTWLDVSGNEMGADGGAHLGRLLACAQGLRYVDASCNALGTDGADYMSLQMEHNTCLTELRLASNHAGAQGALWFAHTVGFCSGLRSVDLSCNGMDPKGAEELVVCIMEGGLSSLQNLFLSQNALADVGVMKLCNGLANHPSLRHLKVNAAEISDDGVGGLAALAASLPVLDRLELAYNRVTDDGFGPFCDWLRVAGSRFKGRHLNLDGNLCGDASVPALCELLRASPWIESVMLRGNFFGTVAALELLQCVRDCPHIHEVLLKGNEIAKDPKGAKAWAELEALLEERNATRAAQPVDEYRPDTALGGVSVASINTLGMTSMGPRSVAGSHEGRTGVASSQVSASVASVRSRRSSGGSGGYSQEV